MKEGAKFYGGVETGGTFCACAIGRRPDEIVAETRFPTADPQKTISQIIDFFRAHAGEHPIVSLGIGSFGPVDLDPNSPTYGYVTRTPKPDWDHVDLCGPIGQKLKVNVVFDTDVNAAAFGEYHWGVGRDATFEGDPLDPLLYVTVGTGIGVGAVVNERPLHGLVHPEAGHMLLPHDRALDPFEGSCPFHQDCWEGLASGAAIEKRHGMRGESLPPDHPAWKLEAFYLGLGLANLMYSLSPRLIVVGGGVMRQPGLLGRVRSVTASVVGDYLLPDGPMRDMQQLIVQPGLGSRSGVLGALALAMRH